MNVPGKAEFLHISNYFQKYYDEMCHELKVNFHF